MARKEKVEVYLTKAEKARAEYCAESADLSVSEWARERFKKDANWKEN
jgi:hypothetical protein